MPVDYFIDIDAIQGFSEDFQPRRQYTGIIFQWGLTQPGTFGQGSGGTAGKASFSDFSFTMQTYKASTKLMQERAEGSHIAKAVLSCRKSTGDGGQQDYTQRDDPVP